MGDILDAELELEYQERHKNLKNSLSDLVDNAKEKGQEVADSLQDSLSTDQTSMSSNTTSDGLNPDKGFSSTWADRGLMHSVEHDIAAMKSSSPEGFESVAAKIDENFGNNALIEYDDIL